MQGEQVWTEVPESVTYDKSFNTLMYFVNLVSTDAAVPPWVGYNEEETIQQQMLALSAVSFTSIFKRLVH